MEEPNYNNVKSDCTILMTNDELVQHLKRISQKVKVRKIKI